MIVVGSGVELKGNFYVLRLLFGVFKKWVQRAAVIDIFVILHQWLRRITPRLGAG